MVNTSSDGDSEASSSGQQPREPSTDSPVGRRLGPPSLARSWISFSSRRPRHQKRSGQETQDCQAGPCLEHSDHGSHRCFILSPNGQARFPSIFYPDSKSALPLLSHLLSFSGCAERAKKKTTVGVSVVFPRQVSTSESRQLQPLSGETFPATNGSLHRPADRYLTGCEVSKCPVPVPGPSKLPK
ncbi:hypothetical protein BJX63DRAFT_293195 [Aspergillus granulosus]|uniref:Uncharacterized protein n=1 Tax=Aspergillus granulosus TaxID=176169 RepID=A0ABR4H793_9EURO